MATATEIEERLAADEWLLPGEVATLLGVDRSTVVRMLNAEPPEMRFRYRPGRGRYRECHPDDVREQLALRRRVHGEPT
ncbi:hypothetical protein [Micromonospora pisi]|nr:hypothetical protein [Micromonospora pisi]